jgi:hypothetical protein
MSSTRGVRKPRDWLISREKAPSAIWPGALHIVSYDCIAIGQELWFERLDFDAF